MMSPRTPPEPVPSDYNEHPSRVRLPGTVHETSPNTSAATASRRNAAAGPIE
jgi:hypothetical protein